MTQSYSREQMEGTEYGGLPGLVQPLPPEQLDNGTRLMLGYTTGVEDDALSLEDRRQMMGLRPASGARPLWLDHVGHEDNERLGSEARRQGFGTDEDLGG